MTGHLMGVGMLRVTNARVKRLLPLSKAIQLAREAYMKLARGEAENPPRSWLSVDRGASIYFMPAYLHGQKTVAVKAARVNPDNSKASLPTVLLTLYVYDSTTGALLAEVEGEWLTAIRTAASTAVATDILARKTTRVLGVFGTGIEAKSHIPALQLVREFEKILVYSRDRKRREAFARKMTKETGISVVATDAGKVARESDVIVTVTTSPKPVFDGSLISEGTHVNAIGSALPTAREVDSGLVERSLVVVDSKTQALATYGDIIMPLEEKAIRVSQILELGQILTGKSQFSRRHGSVTLFKAGGVAVLDAMMANHIVGSVQSGSAIPTALKKPRNF